MQSGEGEQPEEEEGVLEGYFEQACAPAQPLAVLYGIVEEDHSSRPVVEQLHILEGEDGTGSCSWCGQGASNIRASSVRAFASEIASLEAGRLRC